MWWRLQAADFYRFGFAEVGSRLGGVVIVRSVEGEEEINYSCGASDVLTSH